MFLHWVLYCQWCDNNIVRRTRYWLRYLYQRTYEYYYYSTSSTTTSTLAVLLLFSSSSTGSRVTVATQLPYCTWYWTWWYQVTHRARGARALWNSWRKLRVFLRNAKDVDIAILTIIRKSTFQHSIEPYFMGYFYFMTENIGKLSWVTKPKPQNPKQDDLWTTA